MSSECSDSLYDKDRHQKSATSDRWTEILEITCENVSEDWKLIAYNLHTSPQEVQHSASSSKRESSSKFEYCWHVLTSWSARASKTTRARELTTVLSQCGHKRMADIVMKLATSPFESVEDILRPHLDREVRMKEAFYEITDNLYEHWRLLARKLGLTPKQISDIESRDFRRSREKCMTTLYRWRCMVPLQSYKVGSLIQAVNACGFPDVAVKLRPYAGSAAVPAPRRKKRKGEALIHIDVGIVSMAQSQNPSAASAMMPSEALREYVLNRLFIRFLDDLDLQSEIGTHPLVQYFLDIDSSYVSEISRRGMYIVVQCPSRDHVHEIYRLAKTGELSEKLSNFIVKEEILAELGIGQMRLNADLFESELLTVRSQDSSGSTTSRSYGSEVSSTRPV